MNQEIKVTVSQFVYHVNDMSYNTGEFSHERGTMDILAKMLKSRMGIEKLSLRAAAKQIGVSHSTIDRVLDGETVEVDTLIKISEFLNMPVEELIGDASVISKRMDRISNLFSLEPELADVLDKIAQGIKIGDIDKKIITEIAAFAAFRIKHCSD